MLLLLGCDPGDFTPLAAAGRETKAILVCERQLRPYAPGGLAFLARHQAGYPELPYADAWPVLLSAHPMGVFDQNGVFS